LKKKITVLALGAVLLTASFSAEAQQAASKIPRIGYLAFHSPLGADDEAFRQGLRELGYVEGRNIAIEYRFADRSMDRLAQLAIELVRLKVDVVVTTTGQGALRAKEATITIPIVMASSGDAVRQGIVPSLARPGGNVTGLTAISPNLSGKRLEVLMEAFPEISRVGVLGCYNRGIDLGDMEWTEMQLTARALRVQLESLPVRRAGGLQAAFETAIQKRATALVILNCPPAFPPRQTVDLAAKSQLPTIYWSAFYVESGGLMSYGPDYAGLRRRAAVYVDKILKGAKPAELPVEQPTKFELVINLKTARELDLKIPPEMLMWADRVIK
jgi:putative tryptophan/tyrosine transport system substrate-binding protein